MKYFWEDWKKKSKLELAAIKSILEGRKIILTHIPREEIIAVYAKGSFIRREMNKYSDVDTYTILKHSKTISKFKKLSKNYRNKFKPPIQFSSSSLRELKTNKPSKERKGPTTSPAAINEHLPFYKLIYGKSPDRSTLYKGDHKRMLFGMVKFFRNYLLPKYYKKEFHFHELLKQVFWLIEREQRFLGKKTPHSWRTLEYTVGEKNHIIHDTKKLYFNTKHKTDKQKSDFTTKLNQYLNKLEKNYSL